MSLALYRKYRPQKFSGVSGQFHIKTTLQNEIETEKVTHAYIFSGPRGTGKTTLARILAKTINCLKRQKGASEPCDECDACREITEGRSIDVLEIDAASHTGVDNVRENIIQGSRFLPTLRKYKVFIIDEVHMLSLSAFNALLKTVEEPPAHVVFILATTEIHKVPETIISRCQRFDFRKITRAEIIKRLEYIVKNEGREIDADVIDLVARRSEGCVRDAESILGQILSLGDKVINLEQANLVLPSSDTRLVLELMKSLSQNNTQEALEFVNRIASEGVNLEIFFNDAILALRKLLFLKMGGALPHFTEEVRRGEEEEFLSIAKIMEFKDILRALKIFLHYKEMGVSPLVHLPLELAVVESCLRDKEESQEKNDASKPPMKKIINKEGNSQVKKDDKSLNENLLALEELKEKWGACLEKVKVFNHGLFSVLRANEPVAVKKDVVVLGISFSFHKERIEEVKNKIALEKALEDVFQKKLKIECVIIDKKDRPKNKEEKDIEALAQEFGGTVE